MNSLALNFIKYFWFIGSVIGIVNVLLIKRKLDKVPDKEVNEVKKIVQFLFIELIIPFFLLGAVQLLGGYSHPFFPFTANVTVYVVLSWLILLAMWIFPVYIFHIKNGVDLFFKYSTVWNMKSKNKFLVKATPIIVLIFSIGLLVTFISLNLSGKLDGLMVQFK